MRGLDARFDGTDPSGREVIGQLLTRRPKRARRIGGALAVLLLAGGGWLAGQSFALRGLLPDYRTTAGEQRTVNLADGSRLTIDTDGAASVRLDRAARTVSLFHGQVLAQVAHDRARPFVVATTDGTATALGTQFTVRRIDKGTMVTVIESRVRACASTPGACLDLMPGQRAWMDRGGIRRMADVDAETAGAWAEGWLAADDRPVADVLAELNRYRAVPVRFDPAALAGVRVSGSFPLRDTDQALSGIARATGLRLSGAGASLSIGPAS
jgi:transmembrane sensor